MGSLRFTVHGLSALRLLARTGVTDHGQPTANYRLPMPTDLTPQQRSEFLDAHPDWSLDGETIDRTFAFTDFNAAMGFVTRVAIAAEVADHHPDIDIRWNEVTLALTTHDQGALTSKDLALAAEIDAFVD